MTLEEAKDEMLKFVKLKTTMMPVFATVIMEQAEPVKHGRWYVVDGAEPRRYGCSLCKRLSWSEFNFCPHCGAKMDEVDHV